MQSSNKDCHVQSCGPGTSLGECVSGQLEEVEMRQKLGVQWGGGGLVAELESC